MKLTKKYSLMSKGKNTEKFVAVSFIDENGTISESEGITLFRFCANDYAYKKNTPYGFVYNTSYCTMKTLPFMCVYFYDEKL